MSAVAPKPQVLPSPGGDVDMASLGAALWRKKRPILLWTVVAALLTFVVVQMITPRYQSESRVIIESRDNVYLRPDSDKITTDPLVDAEAVTSQAQIILSRDLAREVINKLKLGDLPEFDSTLSGVSPIRALLGLVGIGKDPLSMSHEERVLQAYYDRLSVYPVEKSRIINIDFLSQDPELAAKVANAIAEGYLQRQRENKQEQAKSAGDWLATQIESMRKKVEDAEAKVEDFRAKANLLVGTNNTTLSAQQLGDLNAQLAAARAQKSDAEAKAKLIREMLKSGQPIESSDILNSELIRRLAEQRITLRAQLAEQSSTLLDNHPRIKELRAQIADLDGQIRAEADTVARSFENDAKLAGARVESQMAALDQLKNQAASTNTQDVQLRALEREAKSQRDLLESYLAKYREASSHETINSTPADARIVSRATVSTIPAYPKKLPSVLIAAFATLVLSSGFVLTKEIMAAPAGFAPVRYPEAPADDLGPRVAAFVNEPRRGEQAAAAILPLTSIASAVMTMRGMGGQYAVFAAPGTNASQTAIKLARALADDSRVVLVGLASGSTAMRGISNEPSAQGLSDLASGMASFGSIITKDRLSPLHLISAGHAPVDRIDLLAAPGMIRNFNALARSYDQVVIDAGSVSGPEIERIAEIAPHAMVVTDQPSNAAAARDRLMAAGFRDVRVFVSGTGETAAAA